MSKQIIIITSVWLAILSMLINVKPVGEQSFAYNSLKGLLVKEDVQRLNHKKSWDLTSVKAYRKSLQIKVKTNRPC